MRKVVISRKHGGFGLSVEAENLYGKKKGFEVFRYQQTMFEHKDGVDKYERVDNNESLFTYTYKRDLGETFRSFNDVYDAYWYSAEIDREDPILIEVIEEIGSERASSRFAKLEIAEIPDDVEYFIDEYDGYETIREHHRSW